MLAAPLFAAVNDAQLAGIANENDWPKVGDRPKRFGPNNSESLLKLTKTEFCVAALC